MKTLTIVELIELLENERKNGASIIQLEGTILIPDNGNKILITTQKQM
jgi:hypothetical protein